MTHTEWFNFVLKNNMSSLEKQRQVVICAIAAMLAEICDSKFESIPEDWVKKEDA